jgi:hypothetical protein
MRPNLPFVSTKHTLVTYNITLSLITKTNQGPRCFQKEYSDCFAWNYTEMPGLSREIVEHRLSIKSGFRPFKQKARTFRPDLLPRIKDKIHWLLEADFIRPCRYAEWVSNIVPAEKESGNLRVCIDFRNLNRATPKDEYPMPIADTLINNASGNRIISFLMVMPDITRSPWPKRMRLKRPLYVQTSFVYLNGLS